MEINDKTAEQIRKILKNFENEFFQTKGRRPEKNEIDSRIAKYYKIYWKYKETVKGKPINENAPASTHWTPNLSATWNTTLNKKPDEESTSEVCLERQFNNKENIKFNQENLMVKLRELNNMNHNDSTVSDKKLIYSLKFRQSQYLQQLKQFKENWVRQSTENEISAKDDSGIALNIESTLNEEGELSWIDYMYRYSSNVVPSSKPANITNKPASSISRKRPGDENYCRLNMKRPKFSARKQLFRRNKKYRCFNCGVPGHFAQECPDRLIEQLDQCHRCGESTHQTEHCVAEIYEDFVSEESFELVMPSQDVYAKDLIPSDEEEIHELTFEDQTPNDVKSLFLSLMGDGDDFRYALS